MGRDKRTPEQVASDATLPFSAPIAVSPEHADVITGGRAARGEKDKGGDRGGPVRPGIGARVRRAAGVLGAPVVRGAAGVGSVRAWYRKRAWLPGRVFAAVTQFPALLAVAWLLPGGAMLLAGRLMPKPLLVIFVPLAVALCYFAMRQLPATWPKFGLGTDPLRAEALEEAPASAPAAPAPAPEQKRQPDAVPAWPLVATIVIVAGFVAWQVLEMSRQVIVARDAGEYLQYGYWIAHHGAARIPVSPDAFGGAGLPGLKFASPGFLPNGTILSPQFMPGLPLVLAGGIWAGGITGGLLMAPVLGGCAVLSCAGLAGRLAGARWAPVAALVLALTLPEQYVSRTTLSEPLVQILLFGGLCLVVDSLVVKRGKGLAWQSMTLAGFGGLAIGLTVLANVGSLSIVLPLFPILAIMMVARLPQAAPLAFGLVVGIGFGVVSGAVLARPYLTQLRPQLHTLGIAAAGFGVATALIAPLVFPAVRARLKRIVNWRVPIMGLSGTTHRVPVIAGALEGLAVLVPVALLVGLAVRPSLQVTRGTRDPFVIAFVAGLQKLQGLHVDGRQQYYEQSLNWVIWYVGVPVVLLACVGAALIGRRCLRAVLRWRGSAPASRSWAIALAIIGWSVGTVLIDPAIFPDQPWASRRLVPVVLPGLICLALWACARVWQRASDLGAGRIVGTLVVGCSVLALALPAAVTTFDPGYTSTGHTAARVTLVPTGPVSTGGKTRQLAVRGMAFKATYGKEQYAVTRLCSAIGPSASVIITDHAVAQSFTQVIRGMCGLPTARMDGVPSSDVQQVVAGIQRAGRRPVLLGSTQSSVALAGAVPRLALNLQTTQDAHALTGPPAAPWPLTYTVWLSTPSASSGSTGGT